MTLVINSSYEFQVLQTQSSLGELRAVLREPIAELYGGTKVYRFAVARRYTVVYFAFLKCLVSRLNVDVEKESLGMENIISRCRRYKVLTLDDERMVIKMSMLYATLSYYDEGFSGTDDELLKDMPAMCDFIEKCISFQTIVPVTSAALEAVL